MPLDPITAIADFLIRVMPDRAAADAAKASLQSARDDANVKLALAQISVNAVDAQSGSKFQAWWRPALAWVCLCDVFYETLLYPVLANYARVVSVNDIAITMPILLVLIGARSADKFNGVDSK